MINSWFFFFFCFVLVFLVVSVFLGMGGFFPTSFSSDNRGEIRGSHRTPIVGFQAVGLGAEISAKNEIRRTPCFGGLGAISKLFSAGAQASHPVSGSTTAHRVGSYVSEKEVSSPPMIVLLHLV